MTDFKHMLEIINDSLLTREDKLTLLAAKLSPKYSEINEIKGVPLYFLTPANYLLDFIDFKPEILTYAFDFDILDLLGVKIKITPHIAEQLASVTGCSKEMWLNLQKAYDRQMDMEMNL